MKHKYEKNREGDEDNREKREEKVSLSSTRYGIKKLELIIRCWIFI